MDRRGNLEGLNNGQVNDPQASRGSSLVRRKPQGTLGKAYRQLLRAHAILGVVDEPAMKGFDGPRRRSSEALPGSGHQSPRAGGSGVAAKRLDRSGLLAWIYRLPSDFRKALERRSDHLFEGETPAELVHVKSCLGVSSASISADQTTLAIQPMELCDSQRCLPE